MNEAQITELFKNYTGGKLAGEQRSMIESWYIDYASKSSAVMSADEVASSLAFLRTRLGINQPKRIFKIWTYISIASCLLLTVGLYFYVTLRPNHLVKTAATDVLPGKQTATLTLDNGHKIKLSRSANGEIAHEGNISITKNDDQLVYKIINSNSQQNKFNTLSTAQAETYTVVLPDRSKVKLNAASSLKYPASFSSSNNREVELNGEAYFEISKDAKHPFIVKTGNQEVQVLGTHFNINSYDNEHAITTTLLEGSVQVRSGKTTKVLKIGEQAINKNNQISVSQANIDHTTDWVNGDFYLDDLDFKTAMRKIARWYNLDIVYDQSLPLEGIRTGGWISRNNKLSSILKLIEKSGQVHFKIEGNKLYITKF